MDSKTKRATLEWGREYQEPLADCRYLFYRRPKSGAAGTWTAKLLNKETRKYKQAGLGTADDVLTADGATILTYDQAKRSADVALQRMLRDAALEAGGEIIHKGPFTVADAWTLYIEAAKRRGVVGIPIMTITANAHILPSLGNVQVSRLTKARIEKWHQGIAESGRRKTGKVRNEPELMDAPATEEEIRQRRESANRILTNLKAALTYALNAGKVQEPAPWKQVKPFPNTSANRVRFLSLDEQRKLVSSCDDDLKPLVLAGLFSGARYGELTPVLLRDFDPINGTLYLAFGKGKSGTKPRFVILTDEGIEWFQEYTRGKDAGGLMFLRNDVKRRARAETLGNPNQWASYDQIHAMEQAVKKAAIASVTFHELRHTYASTLLNAGVSLSYVAEQLGHSDLRMVTKYYGHIAKEAMVKAIRNAPRLNLTSETQPPTPSPVL
ncbi:MAG: site-specific integrase [Holophaga sp.]